MISLVDVSRTADPYGPQSAATPASSSGPLPPASKSGQPVDETHPADDVSISAEGVRQLQREAELARELAATQEAINQDAGLAARMAHELAYRREVIISPPSAYSDLATSMFINGSSPASNAANAAKAQSSLEQVRLARIALFEMEKAKGTPPAEIYNQLLALAASQPAGYSVAVAS